MSIVCGSPSCGYEFHDAVLDDVLEAREAGEVPFWSYHRISEDGIGVETVRFCSEDCLMAFLDGDRE